MTKQQIDKMLDRVRKLLAMANDASTTPEEAASFAEKAQAIVAEYNLDMTDIEKDHDEVGFIIDGSYETAPYPWRRRLAMAVAQMYFCDYFYTTYGKPKKDHHSIIGAPHNVAVAKMMFVYLDKTINRLAQEGAHSVPEHERSPYRTTFRNVAAIRVCVRIMDRIELAKRGGIQSESGTTLPALASMYDESKRMAQDFLKGQGVKLKVKSLSTAVIHTKGTRDGDEAGKKIGLDQQVGGNRGSGFMIESKRGGG